MDVKVVTLLLSRARIRPLSETYRFPTLSFSFIQYGADSQLFVLARLGTSSSLRGYILSDLYKRHSTRCFLRSYAS
jgi:hypothetical protein